MRSIYTQILICTVFFLVKNQAYSQCELLFLKGPDTICSSVKEITLQTSKIKDNTAKYVWFLPSGDSMVIMDSFLTTATKAGNYSVLAKTATCRSKTLGPFVVTVLGVQTSGVLTHDTMLCGIKETKLVSQFKTSSSVFGKWIGSAEIVTRDKEETLVKNLKTGKNIFIWEASTIACRAFVRDTFTVNVEEAPVMDNDSYTLDVSNASITIPLGTIKGSNINSIEAIFIDTVKKPTQGVLTIVDKRFQYARKNNFVGEDNFSIKVCNNHCKNLCSKPIEIKISLKFDEQYPNITVPKAFSQQQLGKPFLEIVNIEKYPQNEFLIFNRWGAEVLKIEDYNNDKKAFNGIAYSTYLPTGAYYYLFKVPNLKPLGGIFYILD